MTSVSLLKSQRQVRALLALRTALYLFQSRMLAVLWNMNATRLSALVVGSGSFYGFFALTFGGFSNGPLDLTIFSFRVMYTITRTLLVYLARGGKPLHPGWTLSFEVVVNVLACCVRNSDRMMKQSNAAFIRQQSDLGGTALGYFACQEHGTYVQPVHVHGLEHLWIRAKNACLAPRKRFVLMYYHGGGFTVCSPRMYITIANWLRTSICEQLAQVLGPNMDDIHVDVLLANYRKLPEHAYPIPQQDAYAMYKYVVETLQIPPHQILLGGDSAGAALVMSTMLRVRDQGQQDMLPLGGILSCPFVDMEMKGDDYNAPHCFLDERSTQIVYDAFHPRDEDPTTWGDASPVHCDLTGLPPVLIQAAGLDCVLPHAQRLMKKAEKDGLTTWQLTIQPNVPHVFSNFPASILPQATEGIKVMATFAAKRYVEGMEEKAVYA